MVVLFPVASHIVPARVKALDDLSAELTALAAQGGEFEADAAVSSDHLFKMNVIAVLLTKAGVSEDRFPDGARPKRVAEAADRQARSAAEVQAATEKAGATPQPPEQHRQHGVSWYTVSPAGPPADASLHI
jgi:hypothetical protein